MIPPIARQFVAGETQDQVLSYVDKLNDDGPGAILNLLGEHYTHTDEAASDAQAYISLIRSIEANDQQACVSVKPSQIGLDIGTQQFLHHIAEIADTAAKNNVFLWIDMEDYTTTNATLAAYEQLANTYGDNIGVCVQANLKRTATDLERLAELPGKVRLVKGAYNEPESVAYQDKATVNQKYEEHLKHMFRSFDGGIAIGTHDPRMIELATTLHETHGTPFEIQMLMGVRDDAQVDLTEEYEVWQYVPCGQKWLSYFYRRITERKENVIFALRAVINRQRRQVGSFLSPR